ncbi:hypothetical protein OTU49_014505, partial [Cherax quadricarinatus]
VWYEPTDIQKATKPWMDGRGQKVTFASPNLNELRSICSHLSLGEVRSMPSRAEELPELLIQLLITTQPLLRTMKALMVTLGASGFVIVRHASLDGIDEPLLPVSPGLQVSDRSATLTAEDVVALHFPAPQTAHIVSVSGAGD